MLEQVVLDRKEADPSKERLVVGAFHNLVLQTNERFVSFAIAQDMRCAMQNRPSDALPPLTNNSLGIRDILVISCCKEYLVPNSTQSQS